MTCFRRSVLLRGRTLEVQDSQLASCCQAAKMRMTGSTSCCRRRTFGLSLQRGVHRGILRPISILISLHSCPRELNHPVSSQKTLLLTLSTRTIAAPDNDHCLTLCFTSVLSVLIASLEPAAPWLFGCQGCAPEYVWRGTGPDHPAG